MDAQTINQTVEIAPLIGYELKRAGAAYSVGSCPFCGGRDRFTVKHTRLGDRWHCRRCGDGKYHNVIDFVMRRDDCDFKTALQTLGADKPMKKLSRLNPPEAQPIEPPSHNWQLAAWRFIDGAGDRLFMDEGQSGRDYLSSRGLHRGTWYAWQLGFAHVYDVTLKRSRPAIVIPWITSNEEIITAVKYRFIDDDPDGLRYMCMPGSVPLIFGKQTILSTDVTLLLVEGEINDLSLWQCQPRGVSIISFGAEQEGEIPETRAAILRALARNYKHIVIWCDEANRSMQYQKVLARSCKVLQSPIVDDVKQDANQLLQMGELYAFIRDVMKTVTLNLEDSEQGLRGENMTR